MADQKRFHNYNDDDDGSDDVDVDVHVETYSWIITISISGTARLSGTLRYNMAVWMPLGIHLPVRWLLDHPSRNASGGSRVLNAPSSEL